MHKSLVFCMAVGLTTLGNSAFGGVTVMGDVATNMTPLASVVEGAIESAMAQLYQEQSGHSLLAELFIDEPPTSIPMGSVVDSFYLHFDPIDADVPVMPGYATAMGSITFMNPIIGLIYAESGLDASDTELGVPGQLYNIGRKTEIGVAAVDMLAISGGGFTLDFVLNAMANGVDNVRIVTAGTHNAIPEPASMAVWMSLSALGFIGARRWRKAS